MEGRRRECNPGDEPPRSDPAVKDGFKVVSIRIEYEACVVALVIVGTQTWCTVVPSPHRQSRIVKGNHLRNASRAKGNVASRKEGVAVGYPEVSSGIIYVNRVRRSESDGAIQFETDDVPQGSKNWFIEFPA